MEFPDSPFSVGFQPAEEVAFDLFRADSDQPVSIFDHLAPAFKDFSAQDGKYLAYLYEVFTSLRALLQSGELPDSWSPRGDSDDEPGSFASHFFCSLNGLLQFQVDFLDNDEICCTMLDYASSDSGAIGFCELGALRILPSKSHGDVLILERDRDDLTDERVIFDTSGRLIGAESEIMLNSECYVLYQYFFPRDPAWLPVPLVQASYCNVESEKPYGLGLFTHGTWLRRDHRCLPDSIGYVREGCRSRRIDPDLLEDYRRQLLSYAPYYHILVFGDDQLS